jgi:hypothetical protein
MRILSVVIGLILGAASTLFASITPPASFDWRNVGGINYVSSVKNQGSCGACYSFAGAGALESNLLINDGLRSFDGAEQIIVSCSGQGGCIGGGLGTTAAYIENTGIPLESEYGYIMAAGDCDDAQPGWQARVNRIIDWYDVSNTGDRLVNLKTALVTDGPLVVGMKIYGDFLTYTSGVYSYAYGALQYYHALLLVGYVDSGQYFIVKNSWGSGWGESGYFKISYSQVDGEPKFGHSETGAIAFYSDRDVTPVVSLATPTATSCFDPNYNTSATWSFSGNPGTDLVLKLYKGESLVSTLTPSAYTGHGTGHSGTGSYNWIVGDHAPDTDYSLRVVSAGSYTAQTLPFAIGAKSYPESSSWETFSLKDINGNPVSIEELP